MHFFHDIESRSMKTLFSLFTIVISLFFFLPKTDPAYAETKVIDAQDIFADAEKYGVKIKFSVSWPVEDDTRGGAFGAGLLVNREKGWILTNAHVSTRSPATLRVLFKGGSYIQAKQVYIDTHSDLAVIAVDPKLIPEKVINANLDCSGNVKQGTPVGAYGHPYGLDFSATRGIISSRRFRLGSDEVPSREALQTDAPINGGNSGGPLIDLNNGRVIGVNSASIKSADGLHFAEPIEYACKILDLLNADKDPSASDIGVVFLVDEFFDRLIVSHSLNDAWKEFKYGDRIIAVDGNEKVANLTQLINVLRGKTGNVKFNVSREGKIIEIVAAIKPQPLLTKKNGIILSGMLITKEWFSMEDRFGYQPFLMVDYLDTASPADDEDVASGDRIWMVNGEKVNSLADLWAMLQKTPDAKSIDIVTRRNGKGRGIWYQFQKFTVPIEEKPRKLRPDEAF